MGGRLTPNLVLRIAGVHQLEGNGAVGGEIGAGEKIQLEAPLPKL